MTKIALQGICGRMGRVILDLISEREDCMVVLGIDPACDNSLPCPVLKSPAELEHLDEKPDVIIDFSHPTATDAVLDSCAKTGIPIVVCTTGLSDDTRLKIKATAEKAPVFFSANMSLGINLLARLVKQAQAVLKGFDIEIIEKHHHHKLDAPSGTALMLADAINETAGNTYQYVFDRSPVRQPRGRQELGIHAVRGGSIVGEHDILFAGPDEVVTLSHTAYSRNIFANGAVAAALFMAGKEPGLYSMDNLLEGI